MALKQILNQAVVIAALAFFAGPAHAAPEVGQPAPDFTAIDTNGEEHNLSDFKGDIVVLEWTNHECPYVKKHYESGNMQTLQNEAANEGVTWLTIVSSADGEQGNLSPADANKLMKDLDAQPTARLIDESGEIGKLYEAKTTPHMYVIDQEGVLAYMGAIDDNPSAQQSTIEGATNYVRDAISALVTGEPVTVSNTKPYGCSVKYKSM